VNPKEENNKVNYNWRNTLGDYASLNGVLAGFSVTLIGAVLGWSLANTPAIFEVTFGQLSTLFLGIATILYITAAQFTITAKAHDLTACSERHLRWIANGNEEVLTKIFDNALEKIGRYYFKARNLSNIAIVIFYLGICFLIFPYNNFASITIFVLGSGFEIYQFIEEKNQKPVTTSLDKN
jgi:hypothetical protein